jgi:predicted small secreted protein
LNIVARYISEDFQMFRPSIAAVLVALLALSACANTLGGMVKDAKQTGQAMDSSGHTVLKAGASGNKAATN